VADASGLDRCSGVLEKLFAHPLLENGDALAQSDAILVSLMGGPDLTMAHVNRVMEQIQGRCGKAQVMMGAAVDESFPRSFERDADRRFFPLTLAPRRLPLPLRRRT